MQTVHVIQRLPIRRMMNRPKTSVIWYMQFLLPLVTVSKYLLAVLPFLVSNISNLLIHVNSYNSYNSLLDSISVSNLLLPCCCFFFGPAQLPSLSMSFFFSPYSSEIIFHFTHSYLLWYLPSFSVLSVCLTQLCSTCIMH